jgi:hypothetical protein
MRKLLLAAIFGCLTYGCSQDLPVTPAAPLGREDGYISGPASVDELDVQEQTARLRATLDAMSRQPRFTAHEDFTCENVEEVRVRFSDPGYVDGLSVGLFLKFIGIPAGTKTIRIWWDYETSYDTYQDIPVGDGEVNPEDSGRFDVEFVAEHTYGTPGEKQVRVELILQGQTGNCARNRDVFVTAESFDHVASFGGVGQCFPAFGGMGIRVNFSPPLPAGTTYTVRARLDAAGVFAPAFMGVAFSNAAGPDIFFTPFQFGLPPADFAVTWTTSVPHHQLLVASQLTSFPAATSMNLRVVSISVPGKTVGIIGALSGNCP